MKPGGGGGCGDSGGCGGRGWGEGAAGGNGVEHVTLSVSPEPTTQSLLPQTVTASVRSVGQLALLLELTLKRGVEKSVSTCQTDESE